MKFFRELNQFMMAGARAHARWELEMSNNILKSRTRLLVLGLLLIPVFLGGIAFADSVAAPCPVSSAANPPTVPPTTPT